MTEVLPPRATRIDANTTLSGILRVLGAAQPDAIAVHTDERDLTYSELAAATDALASAILELTGPTPVPVVVFDPTGIDGVIALVAAVKAGMIVAPLDADHPPAHVRALRAHVGASVVIAPAARAADARALGAPWVLSPGVDFGPTRDLPNPDPDRPAWIVFTSGTTGQPAGVVHSHASIAHLRANLGDDRVAVPGTRVATLGAFGTGFGSAALGNVLLNGATLCPYHWAEGGVDGLPAWMRRTEPEIVSGLVPQVVALTHVANRDDLRTVRSVTCGGAPLSTRDLDRIFAILPDDATLVHRLGSSEMRGVANITLTRHDRNAVLDGPSVPVGRLAPWFQHEIVDEHGNAVAAGAGGELVLRGHKGMASGYWNNPAMTAARFHTEPDGTRSFRTHDRVRQRPDGTLEHLGRLDERVKIRSYLVDLPAVERELNAVPGVRSAAATAVAHNDVDGALRLVAYVELEPGAHLTTAALRAPLARALPSVMVPTDFRIVDRMPIAANGKIDRLGLPDLDRGPVPRAIRERPPLPGVESQLLGLARAALGVGDLGVDEDWFEAGADSLGLLEFAAAISTDLGIDVGLSTLVECPSIATLADQSARGARRDNVVVLHPERTGRSFFFFANAHHTRALADGLTDRPVCAVQPHGLDDGTDLDATVAAAVERHVREIRARQAHGPYLLGGYSFGGVLAYETARVLRSAGEAVELVVILDVIPPGSARRPARYRYLDEVAIRRNASPRWWPFVVARDATRAVVRRVELHRFRRDPARVPLRDARRHDYMLSQARHMSRQHEMRTLAVPTLLVRTAPAQRQTAPGVGADLGWGPLVGDALTVVTVPGDHLSLIHEPDVGAVVDAITAELTRLEDSSP